MDSILGSVQLLAPIIEAIKIPHTLIEKLCWIIIIFLFWGVGWGVSGQAKLIKFDDADVKRISYLNGLLILLAQSVLSESCLHVL